MSRRTKLERAVQITPPMMAEASASTIILGVTGTEGAVTFAYILPIGGRGYPLQVELHVKTRAVEGTMACRWVRGKEGRCHSNTLVSSLSDKLWQDYLEGGSDKVYEGLEDIYQQRFRK